ncbi:MAG TPA: hypothetical protein VMF69_28035 [Gemmataceae bacterium]|nr:hypothetical protein [Gemmataceae bacterium]
MNARLISWIFVLTVFAALSLSLSVSSEPSRQDKSRAPDVPERKTITLHADKIPFSKALAELTKQTSIRVEDARGAADEAIDLDWKQTTFWQALDALAAAGKGRVRLYPTSGRIVLDKRGADYRLPPISYDGRFRLCVKKVTTSRDLELSGQNGRGGATNLLVEVAWDPELLPLYLETRPHALRLVDDSNNVVNVPDEGSSLAPVDSGIAVDIDLHLPALPRRVTAIRSLEGKLSMIGPSKMLTFTFETLDRLAQTKANDPERQLTQEGVACRILDVKLLAKRWTIRVALDYPRGMKQLDTNQSWVVNNEMMLESLDGKKRLPSTNYVLESASTRGAVLSYHFLDRDGLARGKASDWRLRYRTPANLVETPIAFAFKDIPLP